MSEGQHEGLEVMGVDGCRGGWLAVIVPRQGSPRLQQASAWRDLPHARMAAVGVDMPIGLGDHGSRGCDTAARKLLPTGRKSSVFEPPRRYMLDCTTWREANDLGKRREGRGLAHQSFNIAAKIAEIDRALSPEAQARVCEVHPELAFHRMNDWRPLPRKREAMGRTARTSLLKRAGLKAVERLLAARPRDVAAADDVLDAAVCALVARDIAAGNGRRLPRDAPVPTDARGLRMEIWY